MIRLRRATLDDVPTLEQWDREPHVIAATTNDPTATTAFDGSDWTEEIAITAEVGPQVWEVLIAELGDGQLDDGGDRSGWRPIGAMLKIDPERKPTHYWGSIEVGLRALDIWIGVADALGRGYGTEMTAGLAIDRCFAEPGVSGIVIDPLLTNTRAHRFYRRLGFTDVGERWFDDDHCLVMRLDRKPPT